MVTRRHICIPACNVHYINKGQKAVSKTNLVKTNLVKAAIGVCLGLSFFSSSAFAQVTEKQSEQPIIVNPISNASSVGKLPGDAQVDIQPETLDLPSAQTLSSKDIKRRKNKRSNRWNTQTLTQSTGLSAINMRDAKALVRPSMTADVRPTDLLNTEDLLSVGGQSAIDITVPLTLESRSDGVINLSSSLRGGLFDLPRDDNVNASVFKLDLAGRPCLGTADDCRANEMRRIDFGYAKNITKGKKNGFNLQITPHGGLRLDEDGQSALVGALVRIGDNLREGSDMKSNTWYLFAGADAEAVTYTPNSVRRLTSGDFHLQDRIIIGDAQAGVGYRIGDADLALTYFKRQAKAENYSYDEDAAALSITWKR